MSGMIITVWLRHVAGAVLRRLLFMNEKKEIPIELLWLEDTDTDRGPFDHWFKRAENKDLGTTNALRDLYMMAKNKQLVGVVAVGLTPDGRYHLLVTGEAYQRPYKAMLGLDRLKDAVRCLLPDLRQEIKRDEE